MPDILLVILGVAVLVLVLLIARLATQATAVRKLPEDLARVLEERHRAMLNDLHGGLAQQSDRLNSRLSEELNLTRETLHRLQLSLAANLGETTDKLNARIDQRLEQIAGKVNERLEEGFKKTNETFVNVMQRLATIDEAQKKIETLTGSVVSLQELLGDKRSRGAFGEVQLEALVRNVLPNQAFEMQYTLSNGTRVDCVLKLPAPTGLVCVDSKFPLENYKLMLDPKANEADRAIAQKAFRADVRKHVDAIASKYIVDNETSDGAVMFVPAEAVFAEIHAYHSEVVDYAIGKRVWIVSPTTLMAVLNTARAVLKDVETRKQIHVIKEALARLAVEFARFDDRLKKLADHIRQAHEDAEKIQITGGKISQQFQRIESAEIEAPEAARLKVVE
ncbi:MAG TPA: DNA recombination protein RmuC [Burkholderiales bacterium]|nr:DNA recombination protein RmuC [Burkholderiales bacterium]